ncbi:rhomboid family intramembrane serine protease [Anaerobacillus sp. MEB173]|uniref:rhomboid family intramembrane serine protease n=1 Tax=Anaerobacillus sp. MEB173 TaxID=3383345 RepID=UPI003F8FE05F
MDVLQQDVQFWHLVHHLVIQEKFRVIEISPSQREVWLEQEGKRNGAVLRLIRTDIDWSNWLRTDIEKVKGKCDLLRRQMGRRSAICYNIYISTYAPVDSWEHLVDEPVYTGKKNQTVIHTMLMDHEQISPLMEKLFHSLSLPLPSSQPSIEGMMDEQYELSLKNQVITEAETRLKEEKQLFTYGKPLFTSILMGIIFFMFLLLEYVGSSTSTLTLIEFGAKYNPLIIEGEWWRLFTAMFLHIGVLHLIMNSLALFYLGSIVERIYGTSRFIIIYFVAGLFGSIASFVFNTNIAAGASGAIFGCFGALLYFGVIHRTLFFRTMGMSVIFILMLNLTLGFTIPMIDNGAHIGGLIGGFFASSFVHLPLHRKRLRQIVFFLLTMIIMVTLFIYGYTNDQSKGSLANVQVAQEMLMRVDQEDLNNDDIHRAYRLLLDAVDHGVDLPESYFLLAYAEAQLGLFEDAKDHLQITIEKRPSFHEAYYNLALIYVEFHQLEEALASVERAIQIENDDLYETLRTRILENLE